jgi:hypothetical protein
VNNVTAEQARKLLGKCALFKALNEQEWCDLPAHAQSRTFGEHPVKIAAALFR